MGGELRDEEVSAAVQIWGKSPPGRRKNKCKGPDVGTMRGHKGRNKSECLEQMSSREA